jgi:hypothetical protein
VLCKGELEWNNIQYESEAVPQHTMKAQGECMYSSYSFMALALDGGDWSASRSDRALPPGRGPRYPLDSSLGWPQSRSGHRLEEKSFCFCRGSNLDRPVVQSVARRYADRYFGSPIFSIPLRICLASKYSLWNFP